MNNIIRGGPDYGYANGHPGSDIQSMTVARSNSLRQHTPPQYRRAQTHIPSPVAEYPEHSSGYQQHPRRSPGPVHPGQIPPEQLHPNHHPGQPQLGQQHEQHPGYIGHNNRGHRDQVSMAGTLPKSVNGDTLPHAGGPDPHLYNGYNNNQPPKSYGGRQMYQDSGVDGYGTIDKDRNAYSSSQQPQSPTGGRYPAYPMGNSNPNVSGQIQHIPGPHPNRPNQYQNKPLSASISNGSNGTLPPHGAQHGHPQSVQHYSRNGPYHDPRNGASQHGGPQYSGPQHGPSPDVDPYGEISSAQQYDRVSGENNIVFIKGNYIIYWAYC